MTQPLTLVHRIEVGIVVQIGVAHSFVSLFFERRLAVRDTTRIAEIDGAANLGAYLGDLFSGFWPEKVGELFEEIFFIVHARLIGAGKQTLRHLA